MTDSIRLTLPWPPTTNTYWRHIGKSTLISKPGRMYAMTVGIQVSQSGVVREHGTQTGRLCVRIVAHPPDRRDRDLDNLLKAALDSLTKAKVWEDDSQIDRLEVTRGMVVVGGRLEVEITSAARVGAA